MSIVILKISSVCAKISVLSGPEDFKPNNIRGFDKKERKKHKNVLIKKDQ